ncbi:MAG: hypothetical protein FJ035_09765 [Chloroflexi bacterium]|nr:hypothetical protein [Chloroflexota bacterium]
MATHTDGQPGRAWMGRRKFLVRATAGAGAVGALAMAPALARRGAGDDDDLASAALPAVDGPLLVFIRDSARGEAVVMHGESERVITDRVLVARLLRAQGSDAV